MRIEGHRFDSKCNIIEDK